ncbi:putative zinc metalloprotease [bioreactor metagenome]|uniref:Putative zinc metalloprotease n=1 Tax=bioreactor metagenome TaxID=1076179 RepID=A0A644T8B2_9ZZZZ|nr:site-2 protease family protein [Candidatus Elulimicrobiales bacterium]
MTILIFIAILLVLVLVHEAGHFFAAKSSGVRVDEFAFGFPPRLFSKTKGETTYSFNAIPVGGYVKIYGENGMDEKNSSENKEEGEIFENKPKPDLKRSFAHKHPLIKIFILSAGVIMNLILAYILITASVYSTTTFAIDRNSEEYQTFVDEGRIRNETVLIANVVKNSPAEMAGLKVGDEVQKITLNAEDVIGQVDNQKTIDINKASGEEITEAVSKAINDTEAKHGDSITVYYKNKKGEDLSTTLAGVYNVEGNKDKKMIGVAFAKTATINLKFSEAVKMGFDKTVEFTKLTLVGFKDLFVNLFTKGSISQDIAGPVGIFGMVGEAKTLGFSYLLLFSAVLSISLAIFNILPFPALDGGRILFVLIEWISGKKIPEKWQGILNGAGFIILILLMVVVTVKDVLKLF